MEIEVAEMPASSMDLDGSNPSDADSNPSSSELIEADQHALQAVEISPPTRRRSRVHRSSSGSPRHSHSKSSSDGSDSSDDPWSVPSLDEITAVMARYHQLQQEFTQQQLALAPDVIPINQGQLAERVAEIMQHRRGKKLLPAEPTGTAAAAGAAAAAARGGGGTDAESSHRGDSSDSEDTPPAAAAAAGGGGDDYPGSRSKKTRPYTAKFSSNEGKAYSRKAFRLQYEQRIPEYVSWSYLTRNEASSGHGQRIMFYTDETGETVPASDDEGDEQKPWNSTDGPSHDYALVQLVQEQQGRRRHVLRALEIGLEQDEEHVTADELLRRWEYLMDQAHPQQAPTEADRRELDFRESTAILHAHFCRRCNIYNCRLHGGNHIKPVRLPKAAPVTAAIAPPCGDSCWKHAASGSFTGIAAAAAAAAADGSNTSQQGQQQQQPAAAAAAPDLSAYELGLLQQGIQCMGRDPCGLALLLLDHTCAQIAAFLATLPEEQIDRREDVEAEGHAAEAAAAAAAASRRKPKKKGWGSSKKDDRSARRHVAFTRERMRTRGEELPPYTPCNCKGPCRRGSCSCIDSANFCEKFCGCFGCDTRDCDFLGCKCTSLCRTELCPCLSEGRECDPELCRNCTATAEGRALPDQCCGNMGIRLRRYKRIYMGLSSVAGWGAFLAEPAKKGDFLGEYVGETLTTQEADRRGKAYDRSNNSYLFAVNRECVLDARDAGNKLRFANHKSVPNCHARVLLVDGDHRVGLYAKEDIAAGEELFYNYRYDLDNAPDWAIKG